MALYQSEDGQKDEGEPVPEEVPPGVTLQMLADAGLFQIPSDPQRALELEQCARAAIAKTLDLEEQKVIMRSFLDREKLQEIADALFINPGQAWKTRRRALGKLRELMRSGKLESGARA